MKCSLGISNYLEEISSLSPVYCFPLFLCFDHWGRLSVLSLLFFGTLHSDGFIFCFVLWRLLLFFSQLLVRPPQTTILPFCISFSWGWSGSLPPVQDHEPGCVVLPALYQTEFLESSSGIASVSFFFFNCFNYFHCDFNFCFPSDKLEKVIVTHSSTLAWKIPWMEESDRLQFVG